MSSSTDPARRRAGLAVLAGAAILAVVLAGTVPAGAAPVPTVGLGSVRTDYANRGLFFAPAWTDAAGAYVNAVSADVRDGDEVVATVALKPDPDAAGIWDPAAPLELAADGGSIPHLGRYTLDLTATDDAGNRATRVDAGTLDFRLQPQFETAPDGSDQTFTGVSATHRDSVVGGVLVGIEPGSGATVALSDRTVTVTQSPDGQDPVSLTATSGQDGAFTTAPFPQTGRASYRSTYSEDSAEVDGSATSPSGSPEVSQSTVHITAKVDRAKADPGQRIVISGTVHRGSSGATAPVAGVLVQLGLTSYQAAPVTVTSDARGAFSGSVVAVADGAYNRWTATPGGFYFTGAEVEGPITIPDEATYRAVGITRAADGQVRAHGLLQRSYAPADAIYHQQRTLLEFSPNGRTGWRQLASARTVYQAARLSARGSPAGYYRLRHPSSDELAGCTTRAVHLSRTSPGP